MWQRRAAIDALGLGLFPLWTSPASAGSCPVQARPSWVIEHWLGSLYEADLRYNSPSISSILRPPHAPPFHRDTSHERGGHHDHGGHLRPAARATPEPQVVQLRLDVVECWVGFGQVSHKRRGQNWAPAMSYQPPTHHSIRYLEQERSLFNKAKPTLRVLELGGK